MVTRIEVNLRGPLFTGAAPAIMRAMLDDIATEVADEGTDRVRAETQVFKAPTGRWKSGLETRQEGNGRAVVAAPGLVYDRWLEGVSRRNQTTRFKGYRLFQNTLHYLRRRGPELAERAVASHIRRLQ